MRSENIIQLLKFQCCIFDQFKPSINLQNNTRIARIRRKVRKERTGRKGLEGKERTARKEWRCKLLFYAMKVRKGWRGEERNDIEKMISGRRRRDWRGKGGEERMARKSGNSI